MPKGSQAVLTSPLSPAPLPGKGGETDRQTGFPTQVRTPKAGWKAGAAPIGRTSWCPTMAPGQGHPVRGLPVPHRSEPQRSPSAAASEPPTSPCACAFKGHCAHVFQTQILNYYFKLWVSYFLKHLPYAEAENGQSVVPFMKLFLSSRN